MGGASIDPNPALPDTNVVPEPIADRPDSRVTAFLSERPQMWLSAVMPREFALGLACHPPGARRDALRAALASFIAESEDRILSLDRIALGWVAWRRARAHRSGRVLDLGDALSAGAARAHVWSLASRSVRDLDRLGVEVTNPWEP